MYRLVISEKAKDTYDRPLEFLGSYNPYSKELKVKEERVHYWLDRGAGMSPTVNNLLISQNIIEGKKVKASRAGEEKEKEETEAKEEKVEGEEQTQPSEEAEQTEKEEGQEEAPKEEKQAEPESTEQKEEEKTA